MVVQFNSGCLCICVAGGVGLFVGVEEEEIKGGGKRGKKAEYMGACVYNWAQV